MTAPSHVTGAEDDLYMCYSSLASISRLSPMSIVIA